MHRDSENLAPPVSDTQMPSPNTTPPGFAESFAAVDLGMSTVNVLPTIPVIDEVLEGQSNVDLITTNDQGTKASEQVSWIHRIFGIFI